MGSLRRQSAAQRTQLEDNITQAVPGHPGVAASSTACLSEGRLCLHRCHTVEVAACSAWELCWRTNPKVL